MSSNNDNVMIQIAVYRRDQNNHDRLKSRQKSDGEIDIYIYVLIVLSFYTYTYITMAEGLKKVFAAKKEQVSSNLFFFEHQLINRMKRMSLQRTKNIDIEN
jgi:hypothetical protein